MSNAQQRDDAYCRAVDQIKEIIARYRTDVAVLRGNARLSPRILMLLLERSEGEIPPDVMSKLRLIADAVLNESEIGIAEMLDEPVSKDVKSEIRKSADSAYSALDELHAEVMQNL